MLLKLLYIFTLTAIISASATNNKNIFCYYSKASEERQDAYRLHPHDIDENLCTHILYAFSIPDLVEGALPKNFFRTLTTEGGAEEFISLRNKNPKLKLMLSIGGWNEGSYRFSKTVSNDKDMNWFIQYIHDFVKYIEFDGIDINWQWPSLRQGSRENDKRRYASFIKNLKTYIEKDAEEKRTRPLLLSIVLPPFKEIVSRGFDLDTISRHVDFLMLWTMDYYLPTEVWVNHHAPLYSVSMRHCHKHSNVDSTVQHYLKMGIDPNKIILGIPLYGHSYVLGSKYDTSIGAAAEDEGDIGFATNSSGTLAYFEICKYINEFGWSVEHPNASVMGPYAYKSKNWVAFDDADIIKRKVQYASRKCLGGIMMWTIDMDDFKGLCSDKFHLVKSAKNTLESSNCGEANEKTLISGNIAPNGQPSQARFKYVKRQKWDAAKPTEEIKKLKVSPVPYVIIAHTVSNPCTNFIECRTQIQNIQSFHISMDYGDIGYNFLIGGDGNAYEGLGWDYHGAHTLPFNRRSICIAFIGDFSTVRPPQKQIDAALKLIDEGVRIEKIRPNYKIFGQSQVIAILSPGKELMDIVKTWPHWMEYDPIQDEQD